MVMYCTKCGIGFEDGDAFCAKCGTSTGRVSSRPSPTARLTRSLYDKKIAGLCGGLGEYLVVDPTLVRLIFVVLLVCFPPFLLGYLVAWMVVPREAPRLAGPVPMSGPVVV